MISTLFYKLTRGLVYLGVLCVLVALAVIVFAGPLFGVYCTGRMSWLWLYAPHIMFVAYMLGDV